MIYITNENGVFLFIDNNGKKQELVDLMDSSENHSRITFACGGNDGQNHYPMLEDTFKYLNTMRDGSPATMMRLTVLLCILNELIQKPRNYQFLHIGDWSAFNENLSDMLQKFNDNSHLYCLTKDYDEKITQNFSNVTIMPMHMNEFLPPESKFSAIFIDDMRIRSLSDIPTEIIMSLKDGGKLFFLTNIHSIPNSLIIPFQEFELQNGVSLISLGITSELKNDLYNKTSKAELKRQKQQILDSINEVSYTIRRMRLLPDTKKCNQLLDKTIKSMHQNEKTLNKIYVELNSMYIKPYFNELKEALIDYRLQDNPKIKQSHYERIENRYMAVIQAMTEREDFVL